MIDLPIKLLALIKPSLYSSLLVTNDCVARDRTKTKGNW